MVGIELAGLPARGAHRPPRHARGARPRRDHPAARRHRRADAPALDPAGRAAPAGGDHRGGDRRRGGRSSASPRPPGRGGGRQPRSARRPPAARPRGTPLSCGRRLEARARRGDLDEADGHRVQAPAAAPLAQAAGGAHARDRHDRPPLGVRGARRSTAARRDRGEHARASPGASTAGPLGLRRSAVAAVPACARAVDPGAARRAASGSAARRLGGWRPAPRARCRRLGARQPSSPRRGRSRASGRRRRDRTTCPGCR